MEGHCRQNPEFLDDLSRAGKRPDLKIRLGRAGLKVAVRSARLLLSYGMDYTEGSSTLDDGKSFSREGQSMAKLDRTKANPWLLKTPPGTAEYTMHVDEKDGVT
jgi:hypothetical protein